MRGYGVPLALAAGLFLLIASAVPALGLTAAPQESAPLSEFEYWNLVERSRQIAAGQQGAPGSQSGQALARLAAEWEAVQAVRLDDGQVISLDHSYVVGLLRGAAPDAEHIKELFETLLAARQRYPGQVFSAADLAALEVLAQRPEFQWRPSQAAENPIARWISEMLARINRWLDDLLGGRDLRIGVGPTGSLLTGLTSIILVLILFYVARTLFQDFVGDSRLGPEAEGAEVLTADTAFNRAMDLSRGGDYRSAVRYLYLSALLMLDERGLLRYDRAKTNREYLRSLAGEPELARPLGEVIEVFDNVWYGYHSLDEESFKHFSRQVEALKERKL